MQEIGQVQEPGAKTIIFVETKRKVENITRNIRRYGWPAVCMHGDKTQQERDEVLYQFKQGRASILVATDVAARGLGKYLYNHRLEIATLLYFLNMYSEFYLMLPICECLFTMIVPMFYITFICFVLSEALAESYCVLSDYCPKFMGKLLHWICR